MATNVGISRNFIIIPHTLARGWTAVPELAELAHKPAGSRPLLSTAVIDFLPARLDLYRFSLVEGIL